MTTTDIESKDHQRTLADELHYLTNLLTDGVGSHEDIVTFHAILDEIIETTLAGNWFAGVKVRLNEAIKLAERIQR